MKGETRTRMTVGGTDESDGDGGDAVCDGGVAAMLLRCSPLSDQLDESRRRGGGGGVVQMAAGDDDDDDLVVAADLVALDCWSSISEQMPCTCMADVPSGCRAEHGWGIRSRQGRRRRRSEVKARTGLR